MPQEQGYMRQQLSELGGREDNLGSNVAHGTSWRPASRFFTVALGVATTAGMARCLSPARLPQLLNDRIRFSTADYGAALLSPERVESRHSPSVRFGWKADVRSPSNRSRRR